MEFTEKNIQEKLALWVFYHLQHKYFATNMFVGFWEADFIPVTKNDMVVEYEIKISRSDFLNDIRNKTHKHDIFRGRREPHYKTKRLLPNRFYYVAPEGVLNKEDIPGPYGFIEVKSYGRQSEHYYFEVAKKAGLLHNEKVNNDLLELLLRRLIRLHYKL